MRNARKKTQDAKHVPPPDPTELPAPGVSEAEARMAEREWEDWSDISGLYRQMDKEERAHLEWWEETHGKQ